MKPLVKICGLNSGPALAAALDNGADMVGFVFFPPSPRNLTPARASEFCDIVPSGIERVGVFVDPDDAFLDDVLGRARLDLIQLHGSETPERVQEVKKRYKVPVIKAFKLADAADLAPVADFELIADWLMFDARPPKDATRPGGHGVSFDWSILTGRRFKRPWLLSGGLTPENVVEAAQQSGAPAVDVSSGVEDAPGMKNPVRIKAFLDAVNNM